MPDYRARRRRVYLCAPPRPSVLTGVAFTELYAAGFDVVCPALVGFRPESTDHLLDLLADDLRALNACELAIILPGADGTSDVALAAMMAVRVVTWAHFRASYSALRLLAA